MMTIVTYLHLQYEIVTSMPPLYVHVVFGLAACKHAGPPTLATDVMVLLTFNSWHTNVKPS